MTVFQSLLNYDFFAVRMSRLSDGQGGWIIGFVDLAQVRGRLRPATGREREVAAQEQRVITHVFYCETAENLGRGDYLSPGSIVIDDGDLRSADIIVQVDGVREPSTADEHYEIDCIEYQTEIAEFETTYLLLESGDVRLTESGDFRILE